jgi:hypothetical protein
MSQKAVVYGKSKLEKIETSISSKHSFLQNQSEFNVAIIVAGSLRSFLFSVESWRRYLIGPWRDNIHIFAHVIDDSYKSGCPIFEVGISELKSIATMYEVSSSTPILSLEYIKQSLPSFYRRYVKDFRGLHNGADYIDMIARRMRAYELSLAYQDKTQITWHAVLMFRFDSVIFEPIVPLYDWYLNLIDIRNCGLSGVMIPWQCNFHGLCDRLIYALAPEMKMYMKPTWPFDVLHWSVDPPDNSSMSSFKKNTTNCPEVNQWFQDRDTFEVVKFDLRRRKGPQATEFFHLAWLVMSNFTQVVVIPMCNFATLRTAYSEAYCNLNRDGFWASMRQHPLKKTIFEKATLFDLVASPMERCGAHYRLANTSLLTKFCCESETNCALK